MVQKVCRSYSNLPVPAKAALWFAFGNVVLKGVGLFSAPLFTRLLSPEEYGRLMVYMVSHEVVLILATWTIPVGAYMRGLFKFKEHIREYTSATLELVHLLVLVCYFFLWIFRDVVFAATGMGIPEFGALFAFLWFYPAYQCWLVRQRVNERYKNVVAVSVLYGVICVLGPLITVLCFEKTASCKYIGTFLGAGIFSLFFYFPYANFAALRNQWEKVRRYWEFSLRFQAPSVLHSLSYLVLGQSDRIMIAVMAGEKEAAYYSVAYTLAMTFNLFQAALLQSVLPWQYKQLETGRFERIKSVNSTLRYYVMGGILLFEVGAPEVLRVLFTQDYFEAIWCVPPVAASLYFLFLYSTLVNVEEYYEKTRYVMYVSIVCSLFNIVANYYMLPRFGYLACAYTTLVSYIFFSIGHYIFARRVVRCALGLPIGTMFSGRDLLWQGFLMTALSLAVLCLYPFPVLRYGIVFAGVGILCVYRRRTLEIFAEIRKERNE